MAQCIKCLLSTREDQSSDPQSPCKCQVGPRPSCNLKGDFPEQAGEIAYLSRLWF